MNEQHQFIIERLSEFLEELNKQDIAPTQEVIELYIKEIYNEINILNSDDNPYFSKHSILEYLYDLADKVCDLAEIFEEKFPNNLNALNFRNLELKIAKQYKELGGTEFWRDIWEIYSDIAVHYSALNIDAKALSSAKTALKLMLKNNTNPNFRWISFLNRRIAYAYQDIAPDKSIIYFNKSSDALVECNKSDESYENNISIAVNNINVAILMLEINQTHDTIKQAEACLDMLESISKQYEENEDIVKYTAYTYGILARALVETKDYENADKAIANGLAYYNKLTDASSAKFYDVADILYSTQSLILCKKQNYMQAIELQYKMLGIWSNYEEGFKRSNKISDIYIDISMIFSKYLDEHGMAVEAARLSLREIRQYTKPNIFKSNKYALSVRRRSYINLADTYLRAKMYQSAISTYTSAIDIMKEEFDMGSEKISLIYSYSYTLYQLALLNFKYDRKSEGCKCLSYSYKSICTLKKYGGTYEILFNMVRNALTTYEKKFEGNIIELDVAQ